jgi:serine/threonine protein phosphatase PrpC
MGGAAAGEVASQIAADTVFDLMMVEEPLASVEDLARRLEAAVLDAGKKIFESARADRSRRGMGTTITAAAMISERVVLAQVGDSRAYLVRGGTMVQVTRDQSLVNQLIEAGQLKPEEAELFEHSNIILQALGTAEDVTVDLTYVDVRQGDTLVMCSDGLSGLVSDERICAMVIEGPEPIDACKALTEAAREGGGHDNITVIVAHFDGDDLAAPGDEAVEFRRLDLPGKSPFAVKGPQAARPSWKATSHEEREAEASGDDDEDDADRLDEKPREGSNPWVMAVAVVVVLALGVMLGYLIVSGTMEGEDGGEGAAPDAVAAPPEVTVEVFFTSDVPGTRLIIDGGDWRVIPDEGLSVPLSPGPHAFEGRHGEEIVIPRRLELRAGQGRTEVQFGVAALLERPIADASVADGAPTTADAALTLDGGVAAEGAGGDGGAPEAPPGPAAPATHVAPPPSGGPRPDAAAAPLTKLPPGERRPPRGSGPIDNNPY